MSKADESQKRQIIRLHKLGFLPTDIADELNTTRDLVNGILRRTGEYRKKVTLNIKKKKRSIRYWSDLYGIPVKSCYEALKGVGEYKNDGVGSPKLMTEREFLSGAVFTREGRSIISKLFKKGIILTTNEIRDKI